MTLTIRGSATPILPPATALADLLRGAPGLAEQLDRWLQEDLGRGDVTSALTVPAGRRVQAVVLVKAPGVLAGLPLVEAVLRRLDPELDWQPLVADGVEIERAELPAEVARLRGEARALLGGERLALNLLQRLSGIASAARAATRLLEGLPTVVLDTRKTTPGLRLLEKYAVRVGGASNHRFGLDDGILIKDNHVRLAGGVGAAVERARRGAPPGLRVEVEVTSLAELDEALAAAAELILLDNMPLDQMRQAVARTAGRVRLEASGGVTLENLRAVAETGVDYVSLGALTHTVRPLDISLEVLA
jgi:nicotinate-nucleotide pyrophosphorylase (carboxylating)